MLNESEALVIVDFTHSQSLFSLSTEADLSHTYTDKRMIRFIGSKSKTRILINGYINARRTNCIKGKKFI